MFAFWIVYDLISYLEGLSFTALLLFHRKNFKVPNFTSKDVLSVVSAGNEQQVFSDYHSNSVNDCFGEE